MNLSFPGAAGFSHQPSAVTCRLPPGAKFSFAQYIEQSSTDYEAPAP